MKWAAASSGGANWSLLNSGGTALTDAQTVTVSGISAKDKILVLISGASSASSDAFMGVRLNSDTGSNYISVGQNFEMSSEFGTGLFKQYTATTTYARLGRMSGNAASALSGFLNISGCNSAGVKAYNGAGMASASGGSTQQGYNIGGVYNSATVISSISVFSDFGNFDAGTVYVYTSA